MRHDPIVEETRQTRARLFAEAGDDLGKFLDRLQASEDQDRARLVTLDVVRKRREAKPSTPPTR
jgi:hypothetical protein